VSKKDRQIRRLQEEARLVWLLADGLKNQLRDYSDDVNNAYRRGVLDGRAGHKLIGEVAE
jgi:hypothetical protein